jgi:hypothetical protein
MATKKEVKGFPQSSSEYDQWIAMGRTFENGKWYEPTSNSNVSSSAPSTDQINQQISNVQSQLSPLQAQMVALKKFGLTDTNQLMQDQNGNWIPKGNTTNNKPTQEEIDQAQQEAQQYFGYELPTGQAPAYYPVQMAELEQEVATAKQRLLQDYNKYLDDINTGKLRVGSDYQKQQENALEQKRQELQQQEFNIKQNMNTLNRSWMARGGLFSGARLQAGQNYLTQENMAKQQYLTGWNYQQGQQKTAYERSLEDYQKQQQQLSTNYQRGTEDIALQRLKDIRSLNETYQQAVSQRMAQNLGEKYYGYTY